MEFKKVLWQWRGVWVAAPSVALLIALLRFLGGLQGLELAIFDQYMRLRPTEKIDDRVVIVGIDEADIRAIGQAIIPDGIYAQLIKKLKAQNPRAIGLDIYRDQAVNPGHKELVEVFESTENLIGIEKVVGDKDRGTIDPPPALKALGQVGANDLIVDPDGKIRRALLAVGDNEGISIPSFGMFAAAMYLQEEGISPEPAGENEEWWRFDETVFVPFLPYDGSYIRGDAGGYQTILNYRGPSRHFKTVSMMDVLNDKIPKDWARDRAVLIGMVGESSNDVFFTPYSGSLLALPERMAGVEIHANIASQILSAVLDNRPSIRSWSEPAEILWIFVWSGIGATLAWTIRHAGKNKITIVKRIGAFLLAAAIIVGTTYTALIFGWWIPVVPPVLALLGSAIAITAYIARTAGDIRNTFGRYLTDEVVATLLENPEGLKMGGERRKITILTSDLRGFTALSEQLSPEKVVKILNFYLGYMAEIIVKHQGTIDEFMGDGILVLFGAPTARGDDPERAISCAIAMQQAMSKVNQKMQQWDLPNLEMGIGINTGEVVVGNIGSEKRTKYGIVGSQVNLTYRIESYTTGGMILISETTLKEIDPTETDVKINGMKEVAPKGVKRPITIYEVGGIGGKYDLYLSKEEEVFLPLTQPIALQYALLDGKNIGKTLFLGKLIQLSAKGGEILLNNLEKASPPPALANIKLNFLGLDLDGERSEDVYGKVLEKSAETQSFYIQFTSRPPRVAQKLNEVYQSINSKNAQG